jgi:energy-coupling factor transport system substrate-specific component
MQKRTDHRLIFSAVLIVAAVPLALALEITVLRDRSGYLVVTAVLAAAMLPFFLAFDRRGPDARELVLICALAAVAVIGRVAFFLLPGFKPVAAIVIVSAVCLGPEAGFLVGALAGFTSNFFFGQGPWTPWQMFAFGAVGFGAGLLFRNRKPGRVTACVYGGLATLMIYGGLMNLESVLTLSTSFSPQAVAAVYLAGFPYDLVHAASTVLFLFFLEEPMRGKIERIRIKYGLANKNSPPEQPEGTGRR